MDPKLLPTDVLHRRGEVQLAELDDGRLVLRHRDGLAVLHGVRRSDVEDVLQLADRWRNVTGLEAVLSPGALRALDGLVGEVLAPRRARGLDAVAVLSNGGVGGRLAERLWAAGMEAAVVPPGSWILGSGS